MTSLSGIGARIAAKRAAHQAKADEWTERLDAIDAIEPALFTRGDLAVSAAEMDIADFENDLKELGSNLSPLPRSVGGSVKSE